MTAPRYRAVKGTRDLLPPESERWDAAERLGRELFRSHGYGEIRTPALEDTALFARSVGETTDIVHKEMYTFPDRKGRSLTLRPENTAGVARAIIENGLAAGPMPLRLYYMGQQFRYERPQAGRYREFRQIGAELFGVPGPEAEAELLEMLFEFLRSLGFQKLSIALNSVGTAETRAAFGEAVREYLEPRASAFGADERRKLAENPLRLLDSRDPAVREALAGSPRVTDFLDAESREHHARVRVLLTEAGVPHYEEPSLVRGLDYYTRTVFEVISKDLSAQDAVLGGGRYDRLVESLGGPPLPAVGFAIGEDRLMQLAPYRAASRGLLLVLPQTREDLPDAFGVAREARRLGLAVEVDLLVRGFRKGMIRANALYEGAGELGWDPERLYALFLGEAERARSTVTIKSLSSGEQETVPRAALAEFLRARVPA